MSINVVIIVLVVNCFITQRVMKGLKPKVVKSSSGDYVTYTVQANDTFYSIAKQYPGISAQNIMDYNGLSSSKIRPGMKIKIPLKL